MYTIIAGSRALSKDEVYQGIELSGISHLITFVISGKCPTGGDYWGEQWALENNITVIPFPADWNDVNAKGALIKYRNGKPHNARAGFLRNEQMAQFASEKQGALIAIVKNNSSGTMDMIKRAKKHKLSIYAFKVNN